MGLVGVLSFVLLVCMQSNVRAFEKLAAYTRAAQLPFSQYIDIKTGDVVIICLKDRGNIFMRRPIGPI